MTRAVMWALLVVVAGAAAVLSFASLRDLAVLCGFTPGLAWLLPVVIDAGAAAGCMVWLSHQSTPCPVGAGRDRAQRFARSLTGVLLASSVAGNAVVHGLSAYHQPAPWWLVVAVSAVAPAVLGATVHLAVLGAQGRTAAAESPVDGLDELPEGPDTPRDWWADAPYADETRPEVSAMADTDSELPVGNTEPDRAAELIEAGAGRRRLARELGVSEHQARRLLAARDGRED